MSRRFIIVGLAALCAVALSALGASGASAAETTAFTCVAGGSEFGNADCSSAGSGFHHEAIPANTETQLTLNTITGETTTLAAEVGGALVELQATGVECMGCMAKNTGSAGAMEVTGSGGTIVFTGVTTPQSSGCQVTGTVTGTTTLGSVETKPLKFSTVATNEAKIEPTSSTVLAEFRIEKKTETSTCTIENNYTVKGDVSGTSSGSILTVNVAKTGTLKLGVNAASLTGKATIEAGETGAAHHPTALT